LQFNPGKLNKKIDIVQFTLTKDSDGFETKVEMTVLNTWAQVTNTSGKELLRQNSDFSEISTRFLIRTPKVDITKDMVIKFGGKSYEIKYINDYSYDKKYTEIMTKLVEK